MRGRVQTLAPAVTSRADRGGDVALEPLDPLVSPLRVLAQAFDEVAEGDRGKLVRMSGLLEQAERLHALDDEKALHVVLGVVAQLKEEGQTRRSSRASGTTQRRQVCPSVSYSRFL